MDKLPAEVFEQIASELNICDKKIAYLFVVNGTVLFAALTCIKSWNLKVIV